MIKEIINKFKNKNKKEDVAEISIASVVEGVVNCASKNSYNKTVEKLNEHGADYKFMDIDKTKEYEAKFKEEFNTIDTPCEIKQEDREMDLSL